MQILIITIVLATAAFELLLQLLTYSRRNAPLPDNVKDIYDAEEYKKNQAYKMDNLKYIIVADGIIDTLLTLAIFVLSIHVWLYGFVEGRNIYAANLFVFLVPIIALFILSAITGIYNTFVIEAKYGFNKMTPITYILDRAKEVIIAAVIYSGLLSLFIFLHGHFGNMVFVFFAFILLGLILAVMLLYPFFRRIFNKLTPLEEGELKTRIEALATKHNFKLKGIYKVDASKRSTKLNAFAAGFGKTKTIGLFDTLMEKMTDDEIIAVLAHEIGHAKYGHVLKRTPLSMLSIVGILFALYFATQPAMSQAFGFEYVNYGFGMFVMIVLTVPLMKLLNIPTRIMSRRNEYQADAFMLEEVGKDVSISMMKKLTKENLGNLTPHPFVVMMEYSHPTSSQRIAAFDTNSNSKPR